jgi:hypothetical protein
MIIKIISRFDVRVADRRTFRRRYATKDVRDQMQRLDPIASRGIEVEGQIPVDTDEDPVSWSK